MINKALALILIFSLAFNIAFAGMWVYNRTRPAPQPPQMVAQPGGPEPKQGPWQQLGLRPEQLRQVMGEWRQLRQRIEAAEAEVRRQRARLFQLLQANELDEQAVRETRAQMEAAQQRVRDLVFDQMFSLRQRLTPEQRRRWVEMMMRFPKGQGGGRGPGPHQGPRSGQRPAPRGMTPGPRRPTPQPGEGNGT